MPTNHAAWLTAAQAHPFEVKESPYPNPEADEVVIKNSALALNPLDWMVQATGFFVQEYPIVLGCDVAGTIVAVGSSVENFKQGDRVLGDCDPIFTKKPSHGGFQEYTVLSATRVAPIPDRMSFQQACVLPTSINTASLSLFSNDLLGLKTPKIGTTPGSAGGAVLIWGGSSSVGSSAIQLARAAGYQVVATASSKNHDYCRELGASYVFDYRKADTVVDEIVSALADKNVVGAFDSVSQDATVKMCAEVLKKTRKEGQGGRKVIGVLPVSEQPDGVTMATVQSLEIPHIKEIWADYLPKALDTGEIKPKPDPIVVGSGLEAVQPGLDKLKAGISAGKLVVTL